MRSTKKYMLRHFSIVFGVTEIRMVIYCLAAYFTAFAIVGTFYLSGFLWDLISKESICGRVVAFVLFIN